MLVDGRLTVGRLTVGRLAVGRLALVEDRAGVRTLGDTGEMRGALERAGDTLRRVVEGLGVVVVVGRRVRPGDGVLRVGVLGCAGLGVARVIVLVLGATDDRLGMVVRLGVVVRD